MACHDRSKAPRRAFTLIEILVVVLVMGMLAQAGMGLLGDTMDIARSRAAGDQLYFLLKRIHDGGRLRSTSADNLALANPNPFGVCLLEGTIVDGRPLTFGFSALPYSSADPIQPLAPSTAWRITTLTGLPLSRLIPMDRGVSLCSRWTGGTFPPTPIGTPTFIQWYDSGRLDDHGTTTGNMFREASPYPDGGDSDAWTIDIVAASGYQRFRFSKFGSISRSAWTDLTVTPPRSESYVAF